MSQAISASSFFRGEDLRPAVRTGSERHSISEGKERSAGSAYSYYTYQKAYSRIKPLRGRDECTEAKIVRWGR